MFAFFATTFRLANRLASISLEERNRLRDRELSGLAGFGASALLGMSVFLIGEIAASCEPGWGRVDPEGNNRLDLIGD
jgi:hypothetical protein